MPDGRVKDAALEALLKTHHSEGARVIVFCLYKKEAERVEQTLLRKGWKCVSLHGDKSQAERTRAFNAFRDKECNLLVATDVAARGVDLPNVEHVINYTFPLTIEDYVHRIGRTGRGDSVGHSWTFFTTADKAHAGALVNVLQTAKQEVPKDMFQFSLATKRKGDSPPFLCARLVSRCCISK
jgi:ATP-dependent RNA helicase DBP3